MKKLYPNLLLILSVAIFGLLPPTAAHASPDSVVQNPIYSDGRTQDASQVKVLYKNNTLTISGFSGVATVEVHDLLGKKLLTIKTSLFKEYLTEISLLQRIQFLLFPLKRLHSISPLRSFQSKSL